jgi:starch phosphorylase
MTLGIGTTPAIGPVAYFSMEIAIADALPSYSGGLGVLAGDHLRSAADLELPVVGVTLLYHDGYFRQHLDADGRQHESTVRWTPSDLLEPLSVRAKVRIGDREVVVAVWRLEITGVTGFRVPVYFLDTRVALNEPEDQLITDQLYGGDLEHRLRQEIVLGMGGVAVLEQLGHTEVASYHMNEGHSALLALALLRRLAPTAGHAEPAHIDEVRSRCVFTTHTPVPAGHDRFPPGLVSELLGVDTLDELDRLGATDHGELNMTLLGMTFSRSINAVALRHEQVSKGMFPQFDIQSVTNGVHAPTWTAPAFQRLFDRHIPSWRRDNTGLHDASGIPLDEVARAHTESKQILLDEVTARTGRRIDPKALTIGVARRATPYKRTDLILSDLDRLEAISSVTPVQIVYAGKAHPKDDPGKDLIARIVGAGDSLAGRVEVVYLEDYSMGLAGILCAGTDVWLNTPTKPHEASGTSGMKAALNGVPSLSVLDGWWIEGHVEGATGWAVGDASPESDDRVEAADLYRKLEEAILPLYYGRPTAFTEVRRSTIALNGSFFNTERMVGQYADRVYRTAKRGPLDSDA